MNKQGHDETITIRISPRLLAEIDHATKQLAFTTLCKLTDHHENPPTRSAALRFLIQVGINYLKNRPPEKGPRIGRKTTATP